MFLPSFIKDAPKPRKRKGLKALQAPQIEIMELRLPDGVVARQSTRAKRLALRLDSKARCFTLVIPPRVSAMRAESFAWSHEAWVKEQLSALPAPIRFGDGVEFSLMGEEYRIVVDYSADYKRTDIRLEGHILHVRTNRDDPHGRVVRFLKGFAKKALGDMAQDKAHGRGLHIAGISIRDTKSRWGSCTSDGCLSFSWRLILAPYAAVDYVVAHEVAHLVHMDHSKDFWAVCEELSSDYAHGKTWMRDHAHALMRYA